MAFCINYYSSDHIIDVEVIIMAKRNRTKAGTDIQEVRQQNQAAADGIENEFAGEFNVNDIRRDNPVQNQARRNKR